jgi:hypothetical protein
MSETNSKVHIPTQDEAESGECWNCDDAFMLISDLLAHRCMEKGE